MSGDLNAVRASRRTVMRVVVPPVQKVKATARTPVKKSCSVSGCEQWRDLKAFTTYHCFPTGNKNCRRWEIWTQLLRRARAEASWMPFKGSLVCSHHFRPEDFINDSSFTRRKLVKEAIPSIFPNFSVDPNSPIFQKAHSTTAPEENDRNGNNQNQNADAYDALDGDFSDDEFEIETNGQTEEDDVNVNYAHVQECQSQDQEEEEDDDEIQVLNELPPPKKTLQPSRLVQIICTDPINNSTRQIIAMKMKKVIPSPKINTATTSSGSSITGMAPIQVSSPPTITLQRSSVSTSTSTPSKVVEKEKEQVKLVTPASPAIEIIPLSSSRATPTKQAKTQTPGGSGLKITREDVEALSIPYSSHPDLQFEVLDSAGVDELAACRQRISDLEEENRSLTTMFENEIQNLKQHYEYEIEKLQRQVRQQKKLLDLEQDSIVPQKKTRLT